MSGRVAGKVAVVTGAASGIGAASARRLAQEGARVVLTDIQEDQGTAVAGELGDAARFVPHDVTDSGVWEEVMDTAEEAFGPVTVLVNNAGISHFGATGSVSEADYRRVIDVNQVSVFLGMNAVIPSMRRAGGGAMINISSTAGIAAIPGAIGYVSSKFAVRGMTKAAALDLGPDRIRVNSVHPGVTRTPMFEALEGSEELEAAVSQIAIGRVANPEEVANAVLFLASDESSYSTGSEFVVDGGWTCG